MPRMKLLNTSEQEMYETPPVFDGAGRKQFFDFSTFLLETAVDLRKPTNQIGFLLACGYFKASKRFFKPQDYHHCDIEYVARRIGLCANNFTAHDYTHRARQRHEKQILEFYGYRRFTKESKDFIGREITSMMRSQLKPRLIFWRCVDVLIHEHIQLPNYYQLSELVLSSLNQRKRELTAIINQERTSETRVLLDSLFVQESEDRYARYKLTLLKKLSQSTKPTQIRVRADDLVYIAELYNSLEPVLSVLNLGYEGIRYFANSVIKSDIFQLNQRASEDRHVHVIAFVAHQYYRLQDNLVDTLLSTVKSFQNGVQRNHKDQYYEQRKDHQQSLKSLVSNLDENVFGLLQKIKNITLDGEAEDVSRLAQIRHLLTRYSDLIPQAEQQWNSLKEAIENDNNDERYNDILEERSLRLQRKFKRVNAETV